MKGTVSVNPIYQSYEIRNPTIFLKNPLLMCDGHKLYFENGASIKWQNKAIINATYSSFYKILMLLCGDSKIYVLTQQLQLITKIGWQPIYSVAFEWIQEMEIFLMLGVSQVQVLTAQLITNVKKTKFLSSMKFNIKQKQKYICDQATKLKWNKGYHYNLKEKILYIWSLVDINFYCLPKIELKASIRNLTKKQLSITTVYFNPQYHYTVTGLQNGHIKVWRLPISTAAINKMQTQQHMLIHTYIYHTKPVQDIIQGFDQRIFMSSSLDLTVCLWSLQTFEMLRVYNFLGQYTKICLIDSHGAFAVKDNIMGKLTFGKVMDFITEINSDVISFHKRPKKQALNYFGEIESIQLTLGSNLGLQIKTESFKAKDLNKTQIQYIYPPLKAKGILQIICSPFDQNQLYLLVETGELFRLRIQNNSGKIQKSYNIQHTQDIQMHFLNQTPTAINFLKIVPSQYDSQIIQNNLEKKEINTNIDLNNQYNKLKLITIGCNKGTIIFLSCNNLQKIYTRVTYHRQAIINMEAIYRPQNKTSYMFSTCIENYFKIVRFDLEKANCLYTVNCGPNLNFIRSFEDRLVMVFQKGFFQVFQFDTNQQLHAIKNVQAADHEDNIYALDYDSKYKLILTAGADNKIKIWTYYKVLIYQIILDEGLKYAVWSQNLQILVSHKLKLLYLRKLDFRFSPEEISYINQQLLQKNDYDLDNCSYNVKQFAEQVNQKIKAMKPQELHLIQKTFKRKTIKKMIEEQAMTKSEYSPPKLIEFKEKNRIMEKSNISSPKRKNLKTRKKAASTYGSSLIEQQEKRQIIPDTDIIATTKHIEEMKSLKKRTNQPILPKIAPSKSTQDSLFDSFMQSKLINKKILTRRDITLNRIIMKNIIKEHFGNDQQTLSNLKLEF